MTKPSTRRKRAAARTAKPKPKPRPKAGAPAKTTKKKTTKKKTTKQRTSQHDIAGVEVQELESLRAEIERLGASGPPRWNADPDDVRRSVGKLVLTLVEFVRQLLERQAIRRMEAGTLTPDQTEAVGLALMRLEETVRDLAGRFGLDPDELNLDLGPVGRLM